MYPRLFELGPFTIYTYGVLLAAAFLLGLRLATARARARGMNAANVLDLGIYVIVAAIVGGKLLLLVTDFQAFRAHPVELLSLARSGGVFYGGLIVAVAVSVWYIWRHKMPVWLTFDVFAPGIALGHAIGRLGCLAAGCCWGHPTHVAWAITFSDPFTGDYVGTPLGVPLHPTQLYEVVAETAILFFLLWFERRGRNFPGRTFWTYIVLYGLSRYTIEFFRGDPRGSVWIFSTSQFISVILVPLAVMMLAYLSQRRASDDVKVAAKPRIGGVGA